MTGFLNRTIPMRWIKGILVSLLVLFLLTMGTIFYAVDQLSQDLPSLESLKNIDPSVKTVIFKPNFCNSLTVAPAIFF